jgi:hypothetical protein
MAAIVAALFAHIFGTCHECRRSIFLPFQDGDVLLCRFCASAWTHDDDAEPKYPNARRRFYVIPEQNLETLQARLDKLNRKAKKLGTSPIVATVNGHEDQAWTETLEDGRKVERVTRYLVVTVTGEAPRLNGWEFVATLDHAGEAGNVLRTVPGVGDLPARFRTSAPICEHCNLSRNRLATFVLRSDTGDYRQVGRNCLGDFLGGATPEGVVGTMEFLASAGDLLGGAEDEGWTGGSRDGGRYELVGFLAAVAAHVRTLGWLSRTQAKDSGRGATVDLTLATMNPRHQHPRGQTSCYTLKGVDMHPETTDADHAEAQAALDWFETEIAPQETLSDYFWNLKVVLSGGGVTEKQTGLAGSLIAAYQREIGRRAEKTARDEAGAQSQHVGQVGERLTLKLTTLSHFEKDGQYGLTVIHKLQDADGNQYTWFCTGEALPVGETVTVKATVKAHGEFRGVAQTTLTRITRVLAKAEAADLEAEVRAAARAEAEAEEACQAAEHSLALLEIAVGGYGVSAPEIEAARAAVEAQRQELAQVIRASVKYGYGDKAARKAYSTAMAEIDRDMRIEEKKNRRALELQAQHAQARVANRAAHVEALAGVPAGAPARIDAEAEVVKAEQAAAEALAKVPGFSPVPTSAEKFAAMVSDQATYLAPSMSYGRDRLRRALALGPERRQAIEIADSLLDLARTYRMGADFISRAAADEAQATVDELQALVYRLRDLDNITRATESLVREIDHLASTVEQFGYAEERNVRRSIQYLEGYLADAERHQVTAEPEIEAARAVLAGLEDRKAAATAAHTARLDQAAQALPAARAAEQAAKADLLAAADLIQVAEDAYEVGWRQVLAAYRSANSDLETVYFSMPRDRRDQGRNPQQPDPEVRAAVQKVVALHREDQA